MIKMLLTVLITGFLASGCATIIPQAIRDRVNRDITFEALKENPAAYEGQMVLLAGVIVKTTNNPTGATLEMYQTQMDWEDRPVHTDASKGRFLVQTNDFLDPEIYSKQREVTVAGTVLGVRLMKLDEMEYPYPVIQAKAIHLWEKIETLPYDPYPWYPMGAPWGPWRFWGPWGPWYGPYWYY
ncbi:MAG: Slp family lipoprotein [Deltaproteobacteria bacterium]|jgi:outer membrane lipoprotein|nr:Slp family lipoprotein [Deltaproteobacteria bacterium]